MNIPAELLYTKSHEWARREGGEVVVGITEHAQQELRDVVFVELPAVGRVVAQGEAVAVVESVKAAFDIYAPVSGRISRTNAALSKTPQKINQACYGDGWMFAINPTASEEIANLMSPSDYSRQLQTEAH